MWKGITCRKLGKDDGYLCLNCFCFYVRKPVCNDFFCFCVRKTVLCKIVSPGKAGFPVQTKLLLGVINVFVSMYEKYR